MEEFVISMGKLAGAIMSVIALFTLIAWKPYTAHRAKVKAKEEAEKQAQQEFQQKVLEGIKSISEDVGDLQCDRLTRAHDYYVALGYCPGDTKQALCKMHASYRSKGRNHLTASYEEDILDLPNTIERQGMANG